MLQIPAWLLTASDVLEWVSQLSVLVPLAIAWRRRVFFTPAVRVLSGYVYLSLFTSLALQIGRHVLHLNNPVQHLYTLLKTLLFGRMYYLALRRPWHRQLVYWLTLGFIGFAALDAFYLEGLTRYNSYGRAVQSLLLIGFAMLYFEQMLRELRVSRLEQDPLFLASVGLVIYSAGTGMLFVLINNFNESLSILTLAFDSVFLLNIAFNVLLSFAFLREPATEVSQR
ncbi:hypothetical protein [Hymenobacter crusticola]|uniref:7TM-DISM receptor extracellular domain-containing protein n=1 Tax=Hymenobacter crusticola TaxID=1770526 RepID=A0A243WDW2_9BACT|nr:hypothetical protein [Hymenobacter crusticola]OUJ73283.1 hypothetical protein BXP70_15825 [Hymenobacter crusticola]